MQTFRYSSTQLQLILDQAGIYMCACPAQLAAQMMELRTLHQYQMNCMSEMPDMADSHRTIADAVFRAHALLEEALDRVLDIEGWDKTSLKMPDGLRKKRDELL
ncbi:MULTISPECIES: hypothetical protein [Methyloversatilis]|jgi:hypothetical protein|nr:MULTISPECIES: hypothetical protein [Methyloversatilis]MBT9518718.1 hypothetical protein [Methyloversatilis discipulorum]MBV5287661.1 hypothetical protein [Methyloversatilis discipulorum]MCR6664580.1 hypothetical protein [Methyloversatilis sp.]PZU52162.1 MAG: hypothetical protein DI561_13775 [Thauera sp.]